MGYLKVKVIKEDDEGNETTLKQPLNIEITENFEATNNNAVLQFYTPDVTSSGRIILNEYDKIVIYAKMVDDNVSTSFTNDDVLFTGIYLEPTRNKSSDANRISLKITDLLYVIFNRMHTESYIGDGLKTNEIIQDIFQRKCEKIDGSGTYLLSFSGIDSTRVDSTSFPVIEPVFANKPVYDWINELSTLQWTNTQTEIDSNNIVNKKPMITRIDDNEVKWYYPSDSEDLTLNKNTVLKSYSENIPNESSVNYLILECGQDLEGEPIFKYIYDSNAGASSITKEKYEHRVSLAGENTEYDNTYNALRVTHTGNNSEFTAAVRKLAESYSEYWFDQFGRAKPTATVILPLQKIRIGQVINNQLSSEHKGLYDIKSVSHRINGNDAQTTIKIEKRDI
ncbi:MAG: hypothetical protein EOL97_09590 [Spirochaetia bacterium]|nr:hypothetical protein [Spirochaetia bacterium]